MKELVAFEVGCVKIVAHENRGDTWYDLLVGGRKVGDFHLGAVAYDSDMVGVPVALLRALIRKD